MAGTNTTTVSNKLTLNSVTDKIVGLMEGKGIPKNWPLFLMFTTSLVMVLMGSVGYLIFKGTGIWGLQVPNAWGWAIVNFVFWVGIGHAGTLISAILFLTRQNWRTSINRSAEAMTIFAVICALVFPTIHVGRIWFIYWTLPYPNQMAMWPNFRSPLMWDVVAVSTYFTVSLLFWYVGLVPDFATARDKAKTKTRKIIFGILALGWRFSNRHWQTYEKAYLLLAGVATPLVLSVHSVVSFDFAVSQVPGWHTTIFPPYFVAGAIFSGFGMVLTLLIMARSLFGLKEFITMAHLDKICKILLATGLMVGYAYTVEFFVAWYSGNEYESFIFKARAFGHYAWAYWIMFSCNVFIPQILWFRKVRQHIPTLFVVSILVNIGMWFERFVITITSLSQDFIPANWGFFTPTIWDALTFLGTFGLFFSCIILFVRFLPSVAMSEVKGTLPDSQPHHDKDENDVK